MQTRVFPLSAPLRYVGFVCVAIIAATYAFGNLPTVSMISQGWLRGARITALGSERSVAQFNPAAPSLAATAVDPNPTMLALASYVAQPERKGKPILFYGRLWALGPIIGVYKRDFLNDNFIYADERGERERGFLEANAQALVLMNAPDYERIWGIRPDSVFDRGEYGMPPSLVKRIASKVSSVHYDAAPLESRLNAARWRKTVGEYVRAHFDSVAAFGSIIVLQRSAR
jgi:hypothetical protein